MVNVPLKDSAVFGKWCWNLRYAHSAMKCIQKSQGGLPALSQALIGKALPGADLPEHQAVLLIWAGQSWCEPRLTLAKCAARYRSLNEVERRLLAMWAAADFLTALLNLLAAQVAKLAPPEGDDDD